MRHESRMGTTNSAISTAAPKVNLSRSGQRLVLTFEGNWSVRHTQHREIDNLFSELDHQTPAEALQFDMSQLSSWDTSLLIVVVRAEEWCREHKVKFLGDSLPPNIASLVALAEEVPERKTGRGNKTSASLFEHVGKKTIATIGGIESTLQFTGETVLSFGRMLRGKAAFDWRLFWLTMEECSAQALPIVGLISFLTGLIFGFVGAVQLRQVGAGIYVANLVAVAMAREMGAIMTGIIMAGRTGAAFAAQIGTMKVSEEGDVLRTLAILPADCALSHDAASCTLCGRSRYTRWSGCRGGNAWYQLGSILEPNAWSDESGRHYHRTSEKCCFRCHRRCCWLPERHSMR